MKKYIILGMYLLLGAYSLWAEDAVFLKIKPGQSVVDFNSSAVSSTKIILQKQHAAKSSAEVQLLPTSVQSQFVTLQEKSWKGALVQYQNNTLQKITFFNEKVDAKLTAELFSELEKTFGPDFNIHPFKSFKDNGITCKWKVNLNSYEFSMAQNHRNKWSYFLEVKSDDAQSNTRPKLDLSSPEVTSLLAALMGNEVLASNAYSSPKTEKNRNF